MASARCCVLINALLLVGHAASEQKWENKVDEKGMQTQSLKIEAPSMTEEDQYGYNMPEQYRCDSCKVVVHHLSEALKRQQPKNRRLKEWEYQELFEETCKSGLSGYGIALVDGQNVLSGPSIKRDNLKPGMGAIQMGGETWEKRLGEECRKLVSEKIGEEELYEYFRSQGELSADLCIRQTRDCHVGPKAPRNAGKVKAPTKDKTSKRGQSDAEVASTMDISSFVSKLAKKHGVRKRAYTSNRSFGEWEQLIMQIAKQTSQRAEQVVDV